MGYRPNNNQPVIIDDCCTTPLTNPLEELGDLIVGDETGAANRLAVGLDGQVLTADSTADLGVAWKYPETGNASIYMFTETLSTVGAPYYKAVNIQDYVQSALPTVTTTVGVSTTPTILGKFLIEAGELGSLNIPIGTLHLHYETEKAVGSNHYYSYAELYKRNGGGTETLLLTFDDTTIVSSNAIVQNNTVALNPDTIPVLVTDKIVIVIYGVMTTGTATIDLLFDDTTESRLELPSAGGGLNNLLDYYLTVSNYSDIASILVGEIPKNILVLTDTVNNGGQPSEYKLYPNGYLMWQASVKI
jgi:hypothetical protein